MDEYQEQDAITRSEIDDIWLRRGCAMSEAMGEMATLSTNVGELRSSVDGCIRQSDRVLKRTDAYLATCAGAILGLVVFVIVHFAPLGEKGRLGAGCAHN
ncbi:MAG: hypothetical protein ACYCSF_04225 [Acidimicrobiales bacterium]